MYRLNFRLVMFLKCLVWHQDDATATFSDWAIKIKHWSRCALSLRTMFVFSSIGHGIPGGEEDGASRSCCQECSSAVSSLHQDHRLWTHQVHRGWRWPLQVPGRNGERENDNNKYYGSIIIVQCFAWHIRYEHNIPVTDSIVNFVNPFMHLPN